jgi:hypothetical protein
MFTLPKGREGPQYPSVSRQKSCGPAEGPDALGLIGIMTATRGASYD